MKFTEYYTAAPMKYWQPSAGDAYCQNVISNPSQYNYIGTEKHDGEWSRVLINNNDVKVQSRSISKQTGEYGDKTELIPHIVTSFSKSGLEETVLLGELCFMDSTKTSKDVGSILRCKAPKAIDRQKTTPLYWIGFDILMYKGEDVSKLGYKERLALLVEVINNNFPNDEYISVTKYVETTKEIEAFVDSIWKAGGEGCVLQEPTYPYECGSRKKYKTVKMKKNTGEIEVKVIRTLDPKRDYSGGEADTWNYGEVFTIDEFGKHFLEKTDKGRRYKDTQHVTELVTKPYYMGWKTGVVVDYKGKEVSVASGFTEADNQWLASDEAVELIKDGKLVLVMSAMEETPDGSLRHPIVIRLRTDA